MRILTPDSNSRCKTTPYGWKYSRLGRSCSGSLDRLVLGHLCTDRPQNTRIRIARARGRTFGSGDWAAKHGVHTWGTADKQWQVSHTRAARAPATQKEQHRSAAEAHWRPSVVPVADIASALAWHGTGIAVHRARCEIFRMHPANRLRPPSPKPRD